MNDSNSDVNCTDCGRLASAEELFCAGCGVGLEPAEGDPAGDENAAPWSVAYVSAGLFLFLGLLIATAFVANALGKLVSEYEQAFKAWLGVHLLALSIGGIVWFLGGRLAQSPLRALGLTAPRTEPGLTTALTAAALAASILLTFAYGFVVDRLDLDYLRPPDIDGDIIFPGVGILLTLQALSVVTPISEELLFRGFALRGLLRSMGPGPAVVASALVFAALHLEPGAMIPIFLTGLALGWLYVKTGSLWPCIAAHAGQNTLALLAARYL